MKTIYNNSFNIGDDVYELSGIISDNYKKGKKSIVYVDGLGNFSAENFENFEEVEEIKKNHDILYISCTSDVDEIYFQIMENIVAYSE